MFDGLARSVPVAREHAPLFAAFSDVSTAGTSPLVIGPQRTPAMAMRFAERFPEIAILDLPRGPEELVFYLSDRAAETSVPEPRMGPFMSFSLKNAASEDIQVALKVSVQRSDSVFRAAAIAPPALAPELAIAASVVAKTNAPVPTAIGVGPTERVQHGNEAREPVIDSPAVFTDARYASVLPPPAQGKLEMSEPVRLAITREAGSMARPSKRSATGEFVLPPPGAEQTDDGDLSSPAPLMAGLVGEIAGISPAALEQGLQHFLDGLNALGKQGMQQATSSEWAKWVTLAAVAGAAGWGIARWQTRRAVPEAVLVGAEEDSSWSWLSNLAEPEQGERP
jgi:hypothetical protein